MGRGRGGEWKGEGEDERERRKGAERTAGESEDDGARDLGPVYRGHGAAVEKGEREEGG